MDMWKTGKKRVIIRLCILFSMGIGAMGCAEQPECAGEARQLLNDNSAKVTITQGVWGDIRFLSGDFMPLVIDDPTGSECPTVEDSGNANIEYVSRRVLVYPLIYNSNLGEVGPFYTPFAEAPLAETYSDQEGFFELALPAGKYSILIEESVDGVAYYYANRGGGQGEIYLVEILSDQATYIEFDITYQATF